MSVGRAELSVQVEVERSRPSVAARIALAPIRLYQRFVSPLVPARCKYHPTCSEYAVQAVRAHGVMRGLVLAGWRLLRCNPLSNGGIDYVEDQRLFKGRPAAH